MSPVVPVSVKVASAISPSAAAQLMVMEPSRLSTTVLPVLAANAAFPDKVVLTFSATFAAVFSVAVRVTATPATVIVEVAGAVGAV